MKGDDPFAPCSVEELGGRLHETPRTFLLLDVREAEELAIAALPGAVHIPLGDLPGRIGELADWREREVLALCHHGVRSAMACRFLREAGFAAVRNVSGGIDAWSLRVDPGCPRY